jgi:hypothetical protein
MRLGKVLLFLVGLTICLFALHRPAEAGDDYYRAGYVMGYQEQASASNADPALTYGRYEAEKAAMLQKEGAVPMHFRRGLRDGFRDALRKRMPRYTLEDVDLSKLPIFLRPVP